MSLNKIIGIVQNSYKLFKFQSSTRCHVLPDLPSVGSSGVTYTPNHCFASAKASLMLVSMACHKNNGEVWECNTSTMKLACETAIDKRQQILLPIYILCIKLCIEMKF